MDEGSLGRERAKLMNNDCFVVLEYIRSSIEIIMSLKIEDLEKEGGSEKARAKLASTLSASSSSTLHRRETAGNES